MAGAMAVYVDDAFLHGDWGRWTGGGHLQADTAEELHAFAEALGLDRAWFQTKPGRPDHDHYDLTETGRERALMLGATPETWRDGARRRRSVRAAPAGGGRSTAGAPT
jgi:hypothetical protein